MVVSYQVITDLSPIRNVEVEMFSIENAVAQAQAQAAVLISEITR